MSEENQPSGHENQEPVANDPQQPANASQNDSVKYDTYRKVLGEKKNLQSKFELAQKELEEFRAKQKESEERELQENNKGQEFAERKEKEAAEALQRVKDYEHREIASRKLDRILNGVGQPIDAKYWGLINVEAVEYDAETGEFDETSLNSEIQRIKNEMPEIISRKKDANYDPSAPNKNGMGNLSVAEYARMSNKDKKANAHRVQGAPDWMKGIMADTNLSDVVGQIQEFWEPVFSEELRTKQIMPMILDASDRIKPGSQIRQGNKVTVSQVNELTGTNQAVSTKTYVSETLDTQEIEITIDQRAYSSLEFVDVVELQSLINLNRPDVREAMARGMNNQINTFLYNLVAPAVANQFYGQATIDAQFLTLMQQAADDLGWPEDDRWAVLDPTYYKNLLDSQVLTNNDFGATDVPVIGGQLVLERYGWKILKDNSATMKTALNAGNPGVGMFFTRNWAHYIPQVGSRFKASDAHSNNEFSIKSTLDTIYGAALGNDGADRHIVARTEA